MQAYEQERADKPDKLWRMWMKIHDLQKKERELERSLQGASE